MWPLCRDPDAGRRRTQPLAHGDESIVTRDDGNGQRTDPERPLYRWAMNAKLGAISGDAC
ncbi:hypothetical protein COC42_00535 [Sphingomonas spermidinifaciens]|uniref:Uncharacterized protein n=1 Tax=Sphingomonas spermidinifaciens TaxID=1141889 RepID=A0A2A4B4T4_9SPHN|nr:hypothetical protein COC42_00535 [Sphingomonas spermidinifaciens]